jgi:hypothetical protein
MLSLEIIRNTNIKSTTKMKKTVLLLFAILMAISINAQWTTNAPVSQSTILGNTITPANGQLWWGYFNADDVNAENFSDMGVNELANYEAAIFIPKNSPSLGGATIKAMRLWLKESTLPKITGLTLWINTSLKPNLQGALYTQEVDPSTLTAGANDIELNTPFSIDNQKLIIGFMIELSSQDHPILHGGEWETYSFYYRTTASGQSNWQTLSSQGKLALQLLLEGAQLPSNYAIAYDFGSHFFQKGDEAIIPIKIKNKGVNPITSLSYTITTNNDPATATPEVTVPINEITYNGIGTLNVSFDTNEAMNCTKTVTITKVNGEPNEATAAESMASGQLVIKAFLFTKVPVVEEFTGTWCGWCPRGFVGMETAHEVYGDQVVLIAAHNGDPMQISDYNPIMQTVSGFPDSRVDRGEDVDPNPDALQGAINPLLQDHPDGKVDITAKWNDEAMTKIDINTSSMFAFGEQNANYGVALVLIEDGLRGSGSSWNQANYYSGQSAPAYMSYWVNAPSSVSGVTFNHVAVAAWQIKNGFDGSVPTSFGAGEALPFNYLADITTKSVIQDKTKLTVAALLINRTTGKIINAAQTEISPYGSDVPSEFYMVGTFNDWNLNEDGGRLAFTATEEENVYETTGTLEDNAEFKVVTPNGDNWTWYGGVDEMGVGYFLINNDLLNHPLTMVDGANFHMENGGEFIFRVNASDMTLTVIPVGNPNIPGDVNGDGFVTAADVTALYNYLLNNDSSSLANGDQDGDGHITAGDVTSVYNILLGNAAPSQKVYVLGEVNGNTWGAATGVQMNTTNGKVFTVQVTTGTNTESTTSYFALTKALASADDKWEEIEDKRFGPHTEGWSNYVINEAVLGQEIPLFTEDWRAFEAPTGEVYNLTVDLEHMTLVVTKVNP